MEKNQKEMLAGIWKRIENIKNLDDNNIVGWNEAQAALQKKIDVYNQMYPQDALIKENIVPEPANTYSTRQIASEDDDCPGLGICLNCKKARTCADYMV